MVNRLSVLCPDCGNPRGALEKTCPFCDSTDLPPVPKKAAGIFTLNLEVDLPTVDQAIEKFDEALNELSGTAIKLIKVIHGYGSRGKGGRIKEAIRQELIYQRRGHLIHSFIAGEDLQAGKEAYQELLRQNPIVKKVLTRDMFSNPGITLVILKK
jgi:hypothetical protein